VRIWCLFFHTWLMSFNIIGSILSRLPQMTGFHPFYAWAISHCVCATYIIHSSVYEHLGWFYFLPSVNSVAKNNGCASFFFICWIHFLWNKVRLLNHMVILYNSIYSFLRSLHTSFYNGYSNLHCNQQCMNSLILNLQRHLLFQ
jgi:hypothetical protein